MSESTLTSTPTERPSLRERKRAQTWNAIHEAAAARAFAHERLSDVSVDAIAEEANVSPRTFFNYFPSKEDAIIGQRSAVVDAELADSFVLEPGDAPVEKTTALLLAVFRSTRSRGGTERRRALLRQHPELTRRSMDHVENVKDVVQHVVAERILALPPWNAGDLTPDSPEVHDAAQMIVLTASGVMRAAAPKLLKASSPVEETQILHDVNNLFQLVAGVRQ